MLKSTEIINHTKLLNEKTTKKIKSKKLNTKVLQVIKCTKIFKINTKILEILMC